MPRKKDFSSPDNSKHFRSLLVLNQPVPEIPIFILVSELIKTFFNCPGFPLISILIKKFLVWYWNMSYKTRQNPFENIFLKGVLNIGSYKNLSRKFPFVTFLSCDSCLVPFSLDFYVLVSVSKNGRSLWVSFKASESQKIQPHRYLDFRRGSLIFELKITLFN